MMKWLTSLFGSDNAVATQQEGREVQTDNPYHVQFVSERGGLDSFGNSITMVKLRCAKTKKTWEEMDYGRNRYNITMERSCDGCGERIPGEELQQDQWGNSREKVLKVLGISDEKDGLNRQQHAMLMEGKCPDCGGNQWYEWMVASGPCGGASQNMYCANDECGSRFNLCLPMFAERISEPKKVANATNPS